MDVYISAFLIAGVIIPISLHIVDSQSMPWWPDTVSMGIAFGVAAVLIVRKAQMDRAMRRRMWAVLKSLAHNRGSN
jgi:hypothetical protein